MSNSRLISGVMLTNNCSKPRNHVIDTITPHYMCWYTSAKTCCESFMPASRQASANYCIGKDGEIWLNVEECNRAWTTGNSANDNRAITIECANYMDTTSDHVYGQLPDRTYNALVLLCADICRRNDIKAINYTGDKTGNLTMHKWFQNTDCPGPWFSKQFNKLANDINKELNVKPTPTPAYDYSGAYRVNVDTLNVRVAPTVNSRIVAEYHRNDIVILENWHTIVNDYVWGRYIGATSGEYRYIAIGKYTGKVEDDDYLIKIS